MDDIVHVKLGEIPCEHDIRHNGYEYYKRELFPRGFNQCYISVYEIPPCKSAYPYHYHAKNEEVFYILSGKGLLRTPEGEKNVSPGEPLFFPGNEKGAHKLTNISESEPLIYLDFDTANDIDVTLYPDAGKVGIWGKNIDKLYKTKDNVGYYEDE